MKPAWFVHADNTAGKDSSARNSYNRQEKNKKRRRCSQCGKWGDDMVAAHVVAYPWFNCCFGFLTLKTTCYKCNQTKNTNRNPRFVGTYDKSNPELTTSMCWLCCFKYDASE